MGRFTKEECEAIDKISDMIDDMPVFLDDLIGEESAKAWGELVGSVYGELKEYNYEI